MNRRPCPGCRKELYCTSGCPYENKKPSQVGIPSTGLEFRESKFTAPSYPDFSKSLKMAPSDRSLMGIPKRTLSPARPLKDDD